MGLIGAIKIIKIFKILIRPIAPNQYLNLIADHNGLDRLFANCFVF